MSSRYLAESYGKLGRISEAEALLRRILEDIRLVGRSPSCIESLNAMTDLGRLLAMQRRYPEARRLLRECLELKRTAIGNDHPDTLTSQHILADALFADGRHEEAESHVREAFNARSRVLGPDHPFTRRSQILLADVLTAQGRREEAEELLRFRTENRPRDLGGSHPDAPSEENRRDQPNGNPTAQKSR